MGDRWVVSVVFCQGFVVYLGEATGGSYPNKKLTSIVHISTGQT